MGLIVITAMLACISIGYYLGRLCTEDHREAQAYAMRHPSGRHALAVPLRLRDTTELAALYGHPHPALESPGAR